MKFNKTKSEENANNFRGSIIVFLIFIIHLAILLHGYPFLTE